MTKFRYRSIWIADIALASEDTRLDALLEFLRTTRSDQLYVIGNLVEPGHLRQRWFWNTSHETLIQKFLQRQRKHPVVTYVTGTHEVFPGPRFDFRAGELRVTREAIHQAADGRRYLIVNGCESSAVLRTAEMKGANGVICGDWVRGCLALVEDQTGCFSRIRFGATVFQPAEAGAGERHAVS